MWSWLKRLLQPAAPARRSAPPPPVPAALPRGAFVAPQAQADAEAPLAGIGLRRPLVGRSGQVTGFELLLAPELEARLARRGDSPSVALHYNVLLASAAAVTAAGRTALLRVPAAMLNRPQLANAATKGMLLLVENIIAVHAHVLNELRGRGVRVGVPDGPPSEALRPDFVVLGARAGGIDTLLLSAQRWREVLPDVGLVALGLEHVEDIENTLRAGATLAGGQLGRSRASVVSRPQGTTTQRISGLLNQLAQDRDTGLIADEVRGDPTLTYRLLRYANSPAIGLKRGVEVVDDAVQLLGRAELRRWLTVQLLASAPKRQATKALEEAALARGRMLEAIAVKRQEANPGAAFTLGVMSLIEPLLQLPLADAVIPLRLGDEVNAALLQRQGPLADRLRMLDALEQSDSKEAEALAAGLGIGADELAVMVDDAWGWSSQVGQSTVAP